MLKPSLASTLESSSSMSVPDATTSAVFCTGSAPLTRQGGTVIDEPGLNDYDAANPSEVKLGGWAIDRPHGNSGSHNPAFFRARVFLAPSPCSLYPCVFFLLGQSRSNDTPSPNSTSTNCWRGVILPILELPGDAFVQT